MNENSASLNPKTEIGRGMLNGFGAILAYAVVFGVLLLLLPDPAEPQVPGGCGCSSK
ncbi:hypothetical protein [Calidithermus timidus]|jgi:hypothetical protein|uniref:hypothetical protein n=1 Tax=Calidithermus timidus TaxID=307124 RepID=UPI0003749CA5|nr:hypothetical protein [Calidithermus timidus]